MTPNDTVIALSQTMINPHSIETLAEARKALAQAQVDLLAATGQYADLINFTRYLNRRLVTLIDAFDAQDEEMLQTELADLSRQLQTERATKNSKLN